MRCSLPGDQKGRDPRKKTVEVSFPLGGVGGNQMGQLCHPALQTLGAHATRASHRSKLHLQSPWTQGPLIKTSASAASANEHTQFLGGHQTECANREASHSDLLNFPLRNHVYLEFDLQRKKKKKNREASRTGWKTSLTHSH